MKIEGKPHYICHYTTKHTSWALPLIGHTKAIVAKLLPPATAGSFMIPTRILQTHFEAVRTIVAASRNTM